MDARWTGVGILLPNFSPRLWYGLVYPRHSAPPSAVLPSVVASGRNVLLPAGLPLPAVALRPGRPDFHPLPLPLLVMYTLLLCCSCLWFSEAQHGHGQYKKHSI